MRTGRTRLLASVLAAAAGMAALTSCGASGSASKVSAPLASASPSAAPIPGVESVDFTAPQYHVHFLGPLTYAQVPPMGGAHSPLPLNCGVYSSPVPNENAVHSLEHGAVWLTYRAGVNPAPLAALTSINPSYTLVSPYPKQSTPVVATAWGRRLTVQSVTDPRLRQFVETYVNNDLGGEPGARCAGVSPAEGTALLHDPRATNPTPPPVPVDRTG